MTLPGEGLLIGQSETADNAERIVWKARKFGGGRGAMVPRNPY